MIRTPPPPESRLKLVHLYRGAPCVRSWSIYKTTVRTWALCGRQGQKKQPIEGTEDLSRVTCEFCQDLAGVKPQTLAIYSTKVESEEAA